MCPSCAASPANTPPSRFLRRSRVTRARGVQSRGRVTAYHAIVVRGTSQSTGPRQCSGRRRSESGRAHSRLGPGLGRGRVTRFAGSEIRPSCKSSISISRTAAMGALKDRGHREAILDTTDRVESHSTVVGSPRRCGSAGPAARGPAWDGDSDGHGTIPIGLFPIATLI